ncbi:hypothetical protein QBC42DRAFT_274752 [Cladorrhinum samala]|uniref:Uncharacterized protein n=1 Tax=Cladorrhinum samala TaxID=585594 RepID=A0AAV9HFI5_9PEZI|nr:hypothetical protein QBC42DRAFT_274752 [Cladorrhinum samala]
MLSLVPKWAYVLQVLAAGFNPKYGQVHRSGACHQGLHFQDPIHLVQYIKHDYIPSSTSHSLLTRRKRPFTSVHFLFNFFSILSKLLPSSYTHIRFID